MNKTIYTKVEVDVDLSDFETDDLIEELESRGSGVMDYGGGKEVLQSIDEKRRLAQNYQTELAAFFIRSIAALDLIISHFPETSELNNERTNSRT